MLEVNEYFEGKVKSIALQTNSLPATVGVMAPGEYTFGTSQHETMAIVSGEIEVLLPGTEQWQTFIEGQVFEIEANQKFQVKVQIDAAYLCKYAN
ncbi:MAG: hypothetical protein COA42_22470 [Alteromonadaceae bacterium]|nr:MAG: hypothetical protein COA42_22470 [Alteromonadaceae bacterium]